MSTLEAAIEAASHELRVFPVVPRGKKPLIRGWQKRATMDPEQIESTWAKEPEANVGIATGRGLIVVDVDSKTGHAALREYGLPPTPTVKTRRGHHMYFAGMTKSRTAVLPGVDIKSTGGYVVGAGSLYSRQGSYEWVIRPDEEAIVDLPSSLQELISSTTSTYKGVRWSRDSLLRRLERGQRDVELFNLARALVFKTGLQQEEVLAALLAFNENRCTPPLPDKEVRKITRSALRYEVAPWVTDPLGWAHSPGLSVNEQALLAAIIRCVDPHGTCHLSYPTITRIAGIKDRNAISNAVQGLVEKGRVSMVSGHSGGKANEYTLLSEPSEWLSIQKDANGIVQVA